MLEDQLTKHFFRGAKQNNRKMGPKAPNPYFYRCKFFPCCFLCLILTFDGKTRRIFKGPWYTRAGRPQWPLHALCVFSGRPLFDRHENPRSKLLLGNKHTKIQSNKKSIKQTINQAHHQSNQTISKERKQTNPKKKPYIKN